MGKKEKLLAKLLAGNSDNNFSISDLATVLRHAGYTHERTSGSHMIFKHETLPMVNLQKRDDGKAKNYQVRQVREILEK
jgi:hypothetical protein